MKDISRRQLLAVGLLARTATLAGCLGRPTNGGASREPNGTDPAGTLTAVSRTTDGSETTGTETGPTEATTRRIPDDVTVGPDATTVQFPTVTDGTVALDGERSISYTNPVDATFTLGGVWDGETVSGERPPLVVSRTLPHDGPPTAYIAPVYRDGGGFEYRIYVNAAFRDVYDWHVLAGPDSRYDEEEHLVRPVAFDEHATGVYRDVVRPGAVPDAAPGRPLAVVLSNYTPEEVVESEPDDAAVVALDPASHTATPTPPEVAFAVSRVDGGVELVHRAGSTLDADDVVVRVDDERADTQFEGSVRAGTSIVVDAPSGSTIEVTYVGETGTTTLAVETAP